MYERWSREGISQQSRKKPVKVLSSRKGPVSGQGGTAILLLTSHLNMLVQSRAQGDFRKLHERDHGVDQITQVHLVLVPSSARRYLQSVAGSI